MKLNDGQSPNKVGINYADNFFCIGKIVVVSIPGKVLANEIEFRGHEYLFTNVIPYVDKEVYLTKIHFL